MSSVRNEKQRKNRVASDIAAAKHNEELDKAHSNHISTTRNMPLKDARTEPPMESASGLEGRRSAGARPPGTMNEWPLTTATGTVSESEQRIMASPYGNVLPPQLTSAGDYKCRVCNQVFATSEAYSEHYGKSHMQQH